MEKEAPGIPRQRISILPTTELSSPKCHSMGKDDRLSPEMLFSAYFQAQFIVAFPLPVIAFRAPVHSLDVPHVFHLGRRQNEGQQ